MSQVIAANPAAFGFNPANQTLACVSTPSCDKTTAAGFSFWDGVHPTEAIHQLLARYASLLLSTEQTGKAVGALGQVGLSTRLELSDILFRRGISPFGEQPTGLYAEVIGSTGSSDGSNTRQLGSTGYDFSLGGVRAGFDADHGNVAFGTSVSYQSGSLSGNLLKSNLQTTQGDVYALARFNPFFVGVEAGASVTDFDRITRETGFPTVQATGATEQLRLYFSGNAWHPISSWLVLHLHQLHALDMLRSTLTASRRLPPFLRCNMATATSQQASIRCVCVRPRRCQVQPRDRLWRSRL